MKRLKLEKKTCLDRRVYRTKQEASAAALKAGYPMIRYSCSRCGGWHLKRGKAHDYAHDHEFTR